MILRRFPGEGMSKEESHRDFSLFHRRNLITNAKTSDISFSTHTAPLSIKTTIRGREVYEVNGIPVVVDENSYLVLNSDQPYASYIYSDEEVESFCVFFRDGFETEVLNMFIQTNEKLLEEQNGYQPSLFFQNLKQHDEFVSPLIKRLHEKIKANETSQIWLDEQFHSLMEGLLKAQKQIHSEIERLPFTRFATRVELYRRLNRAKDFMDSCYDEPLNLEMIARVACLSQHHFLRLFKQMFQVTPYQYLTSVRLERAKNLISKKDLPITEICFSMGFENASSFARLFKKRFGISPSEHRSKKA